MNIHRDELRYDGRVAVVTGAGRGLGRTYALLLAARGAALVVNDLGTSIGGNGTDAGPADEVAAEIVAAGGAAVADTNDVSTADGGAALVDAALTSFGRVDILINNAGIVRWAGMPDVDADNVRRHLDVHVMGSFHTARAAWPRFTDQGYGRIVMTTSSGVFGLPTNTGYAAAKGGVIGLTRSLAVAGEPVGIRVNAIAPAAATRMAGRTPVDEEIMNPALAAPMATYLAHEDCPVTGEIYAAGAGRFARIVLATTPGYLHDGSAPTIEDVAAHWAQINDEAGYTVPADLMAWSREFTAHLKES